MPKAARRKLSPAGDRLTTREWLIAKLMEHGRRDIVASAINGEDEHARTKLAVQYAKAIELVRLGPDEPGCQGPAKETT